MALLTFAGGLALMSAQLWLYRRQRLLYPALQSADRVPYSTSAPTRWFARIKGPFYAVVLADLALHAFALEPQGPPRGRALLGFTVSAAGLGLFAAGMAALAENFAPCDRAVLPFARVRSGPYRYCAHPIYAGNLLLLGGLGIASASPGVGVCWLVLAAFYGFSIRDEERALEQRWPRGIA